MRILMLGNSLTRANGLPELLGERLGAEVVVHARGGARLAEHLNPATRLGALTQEALSHGGIDFVVMQEMSNAPVKTPERFYEAVERLAAQVRASGAKPVLFATWAYAPQSAKLAKLGLSYDAMAVRLRDAYRAVAARTGCAVAEVGEAFRSSEDLASLYAPDGVHPSERGTLLALDVLARTLS